MPASPTSPLVLVGVCAAGKSTVSRLLAERGIWAKPVAQEHSQVPDLYRRTGPVVVLLVASWETVHHRRHLTWDPAFYRTEWERLASARRAASFIIHTDVLSADQVAERVARWFSQRVVPDNRSV